MWLLVKHRGARSGLREVSVALWQLVPSPWPSCGNNWSSSRGKKEQKFQRQDSRCHSAAHKLWLVPFLPRDTGSGSSKSVHSRDILNTGNSFPGVRGTVCRGAHCAAPGWGALGSFSGEAEGAASSHPAFSLTRTYMGICSGCCFGCGTFATVMFLHHKKP